MLYNTVLSQIFSPCGKYLVAGNLYGQLAVFEWVLLHCFGFWLNNWLTVACILTSLIYSLDRVLNPSLELLTADYNKPKHVHKLHNEHQVSSLVSTDKFLIVGSVGEITGYEWKSVLAAKLSKPSWSIKFPSKSPIDELDVNCLLLSEDQELLYAGCGDNNIYVYTLEDGSLKATFKGHSDYIHAVHGKWVTRWFFQRSFSYLWVCLAKLKYNYCVSPFHNNKN